MGEALRDKQVTKKPREIQIMNHYDEFYFPPSTDPLLRDSHAKIKTGIGGIFTKKTVFSKRWRWLVTRRSTGLRTQVVKELGFSWDSV